MSETRSATLSCHLHPGEPAEGVCTKCLRPACGLCLSYFGMALHCAACVRIARRNQRLVLIAALFLVLAGGVTASYLLKDVDFGPKPTAASTAPAEQAPRAATAEVPDCDRRKIIERTERLLQQGEPKASLQLSDQFFAKCGEYLRLRWITYSSYKQLSEWDHAIAEATKLIDDEPYDQDYRWWRGIVYEEKGELERAIQDYRQTLALQPRLHNIPFNLADLLEKVGRPCEALFPIEQYLYYYPSARSDASIRTRLATLRAAGRCESAPGKAVVRFRPGAASIIARAEINGQAGTFVIDTGASMVALTREFATRLGLPRGPTTEIFLSTTNGFTSGTRLTIDQMKLSGVQAGLVDAAIIDNLPEGIDGLVGLSFLARFEMSIDHRNGVLKLAAQN